MFTPLPHQQKIIDRKHNHYGLWLDTGCGKTFTSLWCMEKLGRDNVLVICPRGLVFNKWKKDITELFSNSTPTHHVHNPSRYETLEYQNQVFHVMTKEHFRDKFDHVSPEAKEINGVIADEGHYFSGIKSTMSKKLFTYVNSLPPNEFSMYLLTATPYLSTPWNVYTLARILGEDIHYYRFKKEMFNEIPMGGRRVPVVRKDAQPKLQAILRRVGTFVGIEEVLEDIPPQNINDVYLETTELQAEAIRNIDATEAIVRFTRTHQVENGYVPGEVLLNRKPQTLPCQKRDWVLSYLEKHPHTAIICRYTYQIEALREAIAEHTDLVPYVLTGATKDKEREKIGREARTQPQPIIIQAMISEGYELPEIEHVVFMSMDWGYKNYIQMMGRFLRMNVPTPTTFTRLVAGKVDKRVLEAIKNKQDFYGTTKEK